MQRRAFLGLAGAALVCGCAPVQPRRADFAPMFVDEVQVETSGFTRVTGRQISVTSEQVERDVERALRQRLLGRGDPGGTPALVRVGIRRVSLVSPGQSLLVGGNSSFGSEVSVVDKRTGAFLLEPRAVAASGQGWSAGGVLGASTRPSPALDYQQLVNAYADRVAALLIGAAGPVVATPSGGGTRAPRPPAPTSAPLPGVNVPPGGWNSLRESYWQL
ncbi:MAG: hypothetical protein AAGB05_15320 [Pseudomonadota bacterium]